MAAARWLRLRAAARNERGSAAVEFVLVGSLITALVIVVLQIGVIVHVRNVVHDAAVTGAYQAARMDGEPADGVSTTAAVIRASLGPGYAQDVSVRMSDADVQVTVRAPLPVLALIGFPGVLEVSGHAPRERIEQ